MARLFHSPDLGLCQAWTVETVYKMAAVFVQASMGQMLFSTNTHVALDSNQDFTYRTC